MLGIGSGSNNDEMPNSEEQDAALARELQAVLWADANPDPPIPTEQEMQRIKNESSEQKRRRQVWEGKIQIECFQIAAGPAASKDPGSVECFHYLDHKLDLRTGTCYIWFSIHAAKEKEIVVMMDASVQKVLRANTENPVVVDLYPYEAPMARLVSGQACFPKGSTIKDTDLIHWAWIGEGDFAVKWTPVMRIYQAIAALAKSILSDYCSASKPFPPGGMKSKTLNQSISSKSPHPRATPPSPRVSRKGGGFFHVLRKSNARPNASLVESHPAGRPHSGVLAPSRLNPKVWLQDSKSKPAISRCWKRSSAAVDTAPQPTTEENLPTTISSKTARPPTVDQPAEITCADDNWFKLKDAPEEEEEKVEIQ